MPTSFGSMFRWSATTGYCLAALRAEGTCGLSSSPDSHQSLHGLDQLLRVVADAVFEDDLHFLDVENVGGGVSFDNHQVSLFARSDGPDAGVLAQKTRTVETRNLNRFNRRKTCFDQQLNLAQIAEASHNAAVTGRIEAGYK